MLLSSHNFYGYVTDERTDLQMKTRAENIDADLDKLRVAFSEISRLNDELTGSLS